MGYFMIVGICMGVLILQNRIATKIAMIIAVIFGVSVWSTPSFAVNIYRVGDIIAADSHVKSLNIWRKRNFSIWVGVYESGTRFLMFKSETGLRDADVMVTYDSSIQFELERIVVKGIEWARIAKANKAETEKGIGCLGGDDYEFCKNRGHAFEENQIGFSFLSANEGKQTNLILSLVDQSNQFYNATLYLDVAEMKLLQGLIAKIPEALKKAVQKSKKRGLFK
jgi:hypothetical protein